MLQCRPADCFSMVIVSTPRQIALNQPWDRLLMEGHGCLVRARRVFRYLPSAPRCKVCKNPFGGA